MLEGNRSRFFHHQRERRSVSLWLFRVLVSGLSPITDEREIQNWIGACGVVKDIEIIRFYSGGREDEEIIPKIINDLFKGDNAVFNCSPVCKGKNGHRSRKVFF